MVVVLAQLSEWSVLRPKVVRNNREVTRVIINTIMAELVYNRSLLENGPYYSLPISAL